MEQAAEDVGADRKDSESGNRWVDLRVEPSALNV